jgi:sugar phosphate isomerase/epimerase
MVPGSTLEEKATKLMNWGFEGISVFADYEGWNEEKLQELKNLPERTGIAIGEFVFMDDLYGHLMDKDAELRKKSRQMYKDALAVCTEIGAVTEMEYDYGIQDPLPLFDPYQKMDLAEESEFITLIEELAEVSTKGAGSILIEPINRYETKYLTTLKDCKEVLDKANQPNTGILADFFHMAIEEADLPASIREVKGYIKHVHLGDSNRLLPGYGHTDWEACIAALKDAEFDGFMNLECGIPGDPEVELPKAVEYLQKIIDKCR